MGYMNISIEGSDTASDFDWEIGMCSDKKKHKEMMMQEVKEDHGEWNTPGYVNVALCLVDGNGVGLLNYPWDKEWYDFITKLATVMGNAAAMMKKESPAHAKVLKRLFQALFAKVEDAENKKIS